MAKAGPPSSNTPASPRQAAAIKHRREIEARISAARRAQDDLAGEINHQIRVSAEARILAADLADRVLRLGTARRVDAATARLAADLRDFLGNANT